MKAISLAALFIGSLLLVVAVSRAEWAILDEKIWVPIMLASFLATLWVSLALYVNGKTISLFLSDQLWFMNRITSTSAHWNSANSGIVKGNFKP